MADNATIVTSLLQNVEGQKSAFQQVWLGRFVIKWTCDLQYQLQVSSFLEARIVTLYDISSILVWSLVICQESKPICNTDPIVKLQWLTLSQDEFNNN